MAHVSKQERNPNPANSCLCSPDQRAIDSGPEYFVWDGAELDTPSNPYPVLCSGCPHFKAAVDSEALAGVESDDAAPAAGATVEFEDLPEDLQRQLIADPGFGPGTLVSVGAGDRVELPTDAPVRSVTQLKGALADSE